jgi:hypothetical protein
MTCGYPRPCPVHDLSASPAPPEGLGADTAATDNAQRISRTLDYLDELQRRANLNPDAALIVRASHNVILTPRSASPAPPVREVLADLANEAQEWGLYGGAAPVPPEPDVCPSHRGLVMLPPGSTPDVERHAATGCEHCQRDLAGIRKYAPAEADTPPDQPKENAMPENDLDRMIEALNEAQESEKVTLLAPVEDVAERLLTGIGLNDE